MGSEHTPPQAKLASGTPIVERKLKPDGTVREYPCTLVYRSQTLAIIKFVMQEGGAAFGAPIDVPPGSISYGYFWPRRLYTLYRMLGPDGSLIAHRFDAVADVRISDEVVSYRDLVLDWWVLPDDTLIEEDREELEALLAEGKINAPDARRIEAAARAVFSRYRHIIDEAIAAGRKAGLNPG